MIFCIERFMATRHEEGCYENSVSKLFLVCKKDHRTMTPGWQGASPCFGRCAPGGAGFQTGDIVTEKLGEVTVDRQYLLEELLALPEHKKKCMGGETATTRGALPLSPWSSINRCTTKIVCQQKKNSGIPTTLLR